MEEMVEPDRTITIVSIIGLVIIWGSVAYHKFVQGGGSAKHDTEAAEAGQQGGGTGDGEKKRGDQTKN